MLAAACGALNQGAPDQLERFLHRLDKIDTKEGLGSVRHVAQHHVP